MSALFDLTGKTAVVTGSTKGIGKAIARALAQHGARVVVSSRDEGRVAATERELADEGLAVLGLPCNVGRKPELERLVEETRRAFGQIDIVVANAAINPHYGSFADISDEAFAKIMATNVQSNLWLAQLVADEMRERKDGAIIYVSSIGGTIGSAIIGAYCISKAADLQLVRNLAVELGPAQHPGQRHHAGAGAHGLRAGALGGRGARGGADRAHAAAAARRARRHRGHRGLPGLGRRPLDHRPEFCGGRGYFDSGVGGGFRRASERTRVVRSAFQPVASASSLRRPQWECASSRRA